MFGEQTKISNLVKLSNTLYWTRPYSRQGVKGNIIAYSGENGPRGSETPCSASSQNGFHQSLAPGANTYGD